MKDVCIIVGAGDFDEELFLKNKDGFIIAADGGYSYLKKLNIEPDMVVGDFDSLGYVPEHKRLIKHPVMKDDTDTLLAARQGLSLGYKNFLFFGATGGRIDHTLANIQIMKYIALNGGNAYVLAPDCKMLLVRNKSVEFSENAEGLFSVFSVGDTAVGISISGGLYDLNSFDIKDSFPIGCSNEFIGKRVVVDVKEGCILLVWYDDKIELPE